MSSGNVYQTKKASDMNLKVEREILITEVQNNQDIPASDKDHLRQAINSVYNGAEKSDVNQLANSNVIWTKLNIRMFATLHRIDRKLEDFTHVPKATQFDNKLHSITNLARVLVWPACILVAIIAVALILRPELARTLEEFIHSSR